jgi:hypothetical protein
MNTYTIYIPAVYFKAPNRARDGATAKPQPVRTLVEVEVYNLDDENKAMAEAWTSVNADMMHMVGKTYREWWPE